MRKNFLLAISLSLVFAFSGCVSKTEYEKLKSENEALKQEIDELVNGASSLLIQIRNNFENKNYDEVTKIVSVLHEKFNGTQEDIEAQKILAETQRVLEEQELARKNEIEKSSKDIITMFRAETSKPNSAGGVDVSFAWSNQSFKEIKYIIFEAVPINNVGDIVKCTVREESTFRGKGTGPYKRKSEYEETSFENAWYNNSIKSVKLQQIDIEYMDGTTVTLTKDDLEYLQ